MSGNVTKRPDLSEQPSPIDDDGIDLTEIPEWSEEDFERAKEAAVRGPRQMTIAFSISEQNYQWLTICERDWSALFNRLLDEERARTAE